MNNNLPDPATATTGDIIDAVDTAVDQAGADAIVIVLQAQAHLIAMLVDRVDELLESIAPEEQP